MILGFDDIQASTNTCLAQAYVCAGDLQKAVAAGEQALATFETRGHVWWACRTLWQLIQAANALGEWQRGLAYCRKALEYGQTVDDLRLKVVGWWRWAQRIYSGGLWSKASSVARRRLRSLRPHMMLP